MPIPVESPQRTRHRGLFVVKRTDHHPNMVPLVNILRDMNRIEEIWSSPGRLSTKDSTTDHHLGAFVRFLLSYGHMEKDTDKLMLYLTTHSSKPDLPFRIQVTKQFIPWETLSLYTLSIRPMNCENRPRVTRRNTDEGIRHVLRVLRKAMKPGAIPVFWKKDVNTQRARHRKSGKILLPDFNDLLE